jgi:hypothetical protein
LKIYRSEDEIKGHIVDMLSISDKQVVRELLECAYSDFLEQGIADISCWCPKNRFYSDILREEGFSMTKMKGTFFGVRILDKGDKSLNAVENMSNWHLTMGDSDVF